MKRLIRSSEDIFGMANLNPKRTNLPVIIWSDHGGIERSVSHRNTPRVKIGNKDYWVSVTISESPKIVARSSSIKKSEMEDIKQGIQYVARNYDLFLKHFQDTDFDFDDEDLFNSLRERGEYN